MESSIASQNLTASVTASTTAKSLRRLYFIRTIFSIIWVILLSVFVKSNTTIANILFVIYPAWDVFATYLDIKANPQQVSKTPHYVNIFFGILTTIGVALALQKGVTEALIVFGVWAFVSGLVQLILGITRRKKLGGQWPMIISGGQSMLAGISFVAMANSPTMGISSLAGYSAFGAFYFLLSAIRLSKTIKKLEKAA